MNTDNLWQDPATVEAVWPTAESLAETMKAQILEAIAISAIPAAQVFGADSSPLDVVWTHTDAEDEFPEEPMDDGDNSGEVTAFHARASAIYDAAEALVVAWLEANGPVVDAAEEMKAEILEDIRTGAMPADVADFSSLHDHADANEYAGFCDEDRRAGWSTDDLIAVQEIVDAWLRAGRAA